VNLSILKQVAIAPLFLLYIVARYLTLMG